MSPFIRHVVVGVFSVALIVGCSGGKEHAKGGAGKGGPGGGGDRNRPVAVTVLEVGNSEWTDRLNALGTVVANESVTVAAKVSETVSRVHFSSGQFVRRGTPLVTLTGQQQDASMAEAQAQLREAQALYNRYAALAKDQYVSAAQLDTQRAALEVAKARVSTIRANLSDRVIRAPFAGVLGLRNISPGALITPGTEIATLDDISSVFVDFPVPEVQLPLVRPGQSVVATSQAFAEKPFNGTITNLATRVDPTSRAGTVRARFANPGMELRPGMLLTVNIAQQTRNTLSVPEIAVVQNGADSSVFRVGAENKVSSVRVELGDRQNGLVEIKNGLMAGDKIVVDGVGKMTEGSTIKPAPYVPGGKAPVAEAVAQ